ncbi:transcriptional regulator Hpr [Peribacillus muralis]|uniref:Transcriptional regulator Hpr n=1 Tax=Peribacillus muralis TaxID=264697 RepID=A0A1B3XKU4_9BACI|nr:HTH-type transcriptional regulator Hpr [Peribacillus muralis]AOH53841.1 transcriptional regulator Hpr [Peribacillus muralis]
MQNKNYSMKEAMIFSQRIAQLSKALWKSIEKDWQQWIKPYDLNINEHHILWIAYHLNGSSISDVAKFGVMHVSTAFNFSKKENDKRNTYIEITSEGEKILLDLMETYDPSKNSAFSGALPLRELYGKFPDMIEMMAVIRNIYGEDFMQIFERSFDNIDQEFTDVEGKITKKKIEKETEPV